MGELILIQPIRIGAAPLATPAGLFFLCGSEGMEVTWGDFPRLMKAPPQLQDWNILGLQFPQRFLPNAWGNWNPKEDLTALAHYFGDFLGTGMLGRYQAIALIAHSLGGLVAQRMILDCPEVSSRVSHLALFDVPSSGIAASGSFAFWRGQSADVLADGPFIQKLRSDWTKQFGSSTRFSVLAVSAHEDDVVSEESALGPFRNNRVKRLAGTHRTLSTPKGPESLCFHALLETMTARVNLSPLFSPLQTAIQLTQDHTIIDDFWVDRNRLDDRTAGNLAKALDRLGRRTEAIEYLEQFPRTGTDTFGVLGGLYKRRWLTGHIRADVERAFSLYELGWREATKSDDLPQMYYQGINVAFLTLAFRENLRGAREIAEQVLEACQRHEKLSEPTDKLWRLATEGEAQLICGEASAAAYRYRKALELVPDLVQVDSMTQQAWRVIDLVGIKPDWLDVLRSIFGR